MGGWSKDGSFYNDNNELRRADNKWLQQQEQNRLLEKQNKIMEEQTKALKEQQKKLQKDENDRRLQTYIDNIYETDEEDDDYDEDKEWEETEERVRKKELLKELNDRVNILSYFSIWFSIFIFCGLLLMVLYFMHEDIGFTLFNLGLKIYVGILIFIPVIFIVKRILLSRELNKELNEKLKRISITNKPRQNNSEKKTNLKIDKDKSKTELIEVKDMEKEMEEIDKLFLDKYKLFLNKDEYINMKELEDLDENLRILQKNINNKKKEISTNLDYPKQETNEYKLTSEEDYYDSLLLKSIELLIEEDVITNFLLQNKFNIGYARTSRIIDQMEELGIVNEYTGSSTRTIMITKAEAEVIKSKIKEVVDNDESSSNL